VDARVDNGGIEQGGAAGIDRSESGVDAERGTIGTVREHGLYCVGHGDDPSADGHLLAEEAVGVARSIEAFVVLEDQLADRPWEIDASDDVLAGLSVFLD